MANSSVDSTSSQVVSAELEAIYASGIGHNAGIKLLQMGDLALLVNVLMRWGCTRTRV